jgi:hypothetical protein
MPLTWGEPVNTVDATSGPAGSTPSRISGGQYAGERAGAERSLPVSAGDRLKGRAWVTQRPDARLERIVLANHSDQSVTGIGANANRTDGEVARCVTQVLGFPPRGIVTEESFLRSGPRSP